jgi:hypothetical protein
MIAEALPRYQPSVSLTLPGRKSRNAYELPDGLDYGEVLSIRDSVEMLVEASPWWLVDVVRYLKAHFPEKRVLPAAGDDPNGVRAERLKQAIWMGEKFPPATRVAGLSFTHHRAVAELEPADRATLLREALSERLSTRALSERVKARQEALSGQSDAPDEPVARNVVPLRRPRRQTTSGPLVEAQPWDRPHPPTRKEVLRGAEEVSPSLDDDRVLEQVVRAALGSLEAWERVFGTHRDHPSFAAIFEPVLLVIDEVRGRVGLREVS